MPGQQTPPPRRPPPTGQARPVTAIVVRRFHLAIVDEAGRPTIRICEVPQQLVQQTADFLAEFMPTLRGLANIKGQVSALVGSFSRTFGGTESSSAPPRRRRRR